ncbi:MAG: peptidase S10 [Acidobacteriota bacterium]|nr:peptidase S10 [Acidobacteriota bacterium]
MRQLVTLVVIAASFTLASPARAQAPAPPAQTAPPAGAPAKAPAPPSEEWSTTQHTLKLGSQTIPYTAKAGTTAIKDDEGETMGLMYSVSYIRSGDADASSRPVTFLFNGGPGSASMWLHMGSVGPKRVVTSNDQYTAPAPYPIVDNAETILHRTDLVFIDAMGTGFSRIAGKGKESDFYGVDADGASFAQFITTWLSRNGRWNSPKFIIGESYGTFRAAVVSNMLQQRGVHLNGVNLLSMVLDLSTITFGPGDDRPYIFYLPSYAAVAWYHEALASRPASLEQLLADARQYAVTDYASALMKGSALTEAETRAVARRLSALTGLSEDYLIRANLRPTLGQFNAELMRSRRMTAGRIDARFAGDTFNQLTENAEGDPFNNAVGSAYTAAVNHFTREVLKFGDDRPYRNTNGAGGRWTWARRGGGFFFPGAPNVQGDLVAAMIANPHMVVQVENGYYDMATPFFPAEFTMSHLGIPARLQKNVTLKYYQAGHMMYLRDEDRVALRNNLIAFIDNGLRKP